MHLGYNNLCSASSVEYTFHKGRFISVSFGIVLSALYTAVRTLGA